MRYIFINVLICCIGWDVGVGVAYRLIVTKCIDNLLVKNRNMVKFYNIGGEKGYLIK